GKSDQASLLEQTHDEEKETDEKLTAFAKQINPQADSAERSGEKAKQLSFRRNKTPAAGGIVTTIKSEYGEKMRVRASCRAPSQNSRPCSAARSLQACWFSESPKVGREKNQVRIFRKRLHRQALHG